MAQQQSCYDLHLIRPLIEEESWPVFVYSIGSLSSIVIPRISLILSSDIVYPHSLYIINVVTQIKDEED